jgi:hypothetical protein
MIAGLVTIVARLAVSLATMIEADITPARGIVTIRALACKVVGRPVPVMTGNTIPGSGDLMIETGRKPARGAVAGRTLVPIMTSRLVVLMALNTIQASYQGMVKVDIVPRNRCMACATIPHIMLFWTLFCVAGLTPGWGAAINLIQMAGCTFQSAVDAH